MDQYKTILDREDTLDNKCWICGKQEPMMFTCRHCGKTFCSDHRLPERHACEGLGRGEGYSYGNSGTSGNYNRTYKGGQSYGPEMDEVIKNMMKDAAKTAAKGAATSLVISAKRQPFKAWGAYLASIGAQASVVAESEFYKLMIGQEM